MRNCRFLPYGIAILVMFGLVSGCSRGPSEEELAQAAFEEQLATLQQQYEELQQARTDLTASEAMLAEIEAIKDIDGIPRGGEGLKPKGIVTKSDVEALANC